MEKLFARTTRERQNESAGVKNIFEGLTFCMSGNVATNSDSAPFVCSVSRTLIDGSAPAQVFFFFQPVELRIQSQALANTANISLRDEQL